MRVLVACEFSGIVRDEFSRRGHDAWSCDLLDSEKTGRHIKGDAIAAARSGSWDMLIFHAPCTRLCNSGVRWLAERDLWKQMEEAALFFRTLLETDVPHICGENPIPHRYAVALIGRKYDQIIQPWQFGHGETKATCLWLKNLPPLMPTDVVDGRRDRVHMEPPGPERWKNRSRTYPGIARAMAEQWGTI